MDELLDINTINSFQAKTQISSIMNKIEEYEISLSNIKREKEGKKFENKTNLQILEKEKNALIESMNKTIEELNIKKDKIYEVQKDDFLEFQKNIKKYETIIKEIKEKKEKNNKHLESNKNKELIYYNNSMMIYEDNIHLKTKIKEKQDEIIKFENEIKSIKSSYPNEFIFLLDDISYHERLCLLECQVEHVKQQKLNEESKLSNYDSYLQKNIYNLLKLKTDFQLLSNRLNNSNNFNFFDEFNKKINTKFSEYTPFIKCKEILLFYYQHKNYSKFHFFEHNTINSFIDMSKSLIEFIEQKKNVVSDNIEQIKRKLQRLNNLVKNKKNETQIKQFENKLTKATIDKTILEETTPIVNTLNQFLENTLKNEKVEIFRESFEDNFIEIITNIFEKMNEVYINIISKTALKKEKSDDKLSFKVLFLLLIKKLNSHFENIFNIKNSLNETQNKINETQDTINKSNIDIKQIKEKIVSITDELSLIEKEIDNKKIFASKKVLEINKKIKGYTVEEYEKYLKLNPSLFQYLINSTGKVVENELLITKSNFLKGIQIDHFRKKFSLSESIKNKYEYETYLNWYNTYLKQNNLIYDKINNNKDNVNKEIIKISNEQIFLDKFLDSMDKVKIENMNKYEEFLDYDKENLNCEYNIYSNLNRLKELNNKIDSIEQKINEIKSNEAEQETSYKKIEDKIIEEINELKEDLDNKIYLYQNKIGFQTIDDINNKITSSTINDKKEKNPINYLNLHKKIVLICKNELFLYLRVNPNKKISFNFESPSDNPPEKCGYAIRLFNVNLKLCQIEIKNLKNNHIEKKIKMKDIKYIILEPKVRAFIKDIKKNIKNENELSLVDKKDFIPFTLISGEDTFQLISQNILSFIYFSEAIEYIISKKLNIVMICKNIDLALNNKN